MQQQLASLLAMIPEEKHDEFLNLLPPGTAAALVNESANVDEATLQIVADAVWACLES